MFGAYARKMHERAVATVGIGLSLRVQCRCRKLLGNVRPGNETMQRRHSPDLRFDGDLGQRHRVHQRLLQRRLHGFVHAERKAVQQQYPPDVRLDGQMGQWDSVPKCM